MQSKNCFRKVFIIFFLVCIAVLFYLRNSAVPFYSDDYGWAWMLPHESFWGDVKLLLSKLNLQPQTCGRLTCHLACQFLLTLGEPFFDWINTVIFLLTVILVVKFSFSSENRLNPVAWCWVVGALLYGVPNSESLFYWGSGSCNYLFPLLLVAGFLLLLRHTKTVTISGIYLPLWCIYAFACGWSNEIFALPLATALFCFSLFHYRKLNVQQWLLVFFFISGACCLFFHPGSLGRLESPGGMVLLSIDIPRLLQCFKMFRDGFWLYILLIAMVYIAISSRHSLKTLLIRHGFLFFSLFMSICMIAIIGHGGRAIWGIECFSFLILLRMCDELITDNRKSRWIYPVALVLILHQVLLIKPTFETWQKYRDAEEMAFSGSYGMKTIPIEDYHSRFKIIDAFVAHPYEMMMRDMWVRIPNCHSFCRSDIYEALKESPLPDTLSAVSVAGELVLPASSSSKNALMEGRIVSSLAPISFASEGRWLRLVWHQFLQKLIPSRYPTDYVMTEQDIIPLHIEDREYFLFNKPLSPIWREITGVQILPQTVEP